MSLGMREMARLVGPYAAVIACQNSVEILGRQRAAAHGAADIGLPPRELPAPPARCRACDGDGCRPQHP